MPDHVGGLVYLPIIVSLPVPFSHQHSQCVPTVGAVLHQVWQVTAVCPGPTNASELTNAYLTSPAGLLDPTFACKLST
jgi:hypothetical protein